MVLGCGFDIKKLPIKLPKFSTRNAFKLSLSILQHALSESNVWTTTLERT